MHHQYGDHVALRGVDLQTNAGEIVALLGKNGSGKTTLFRLLCTLMPIQKGSVHIGGTNVATDPLAVRGKIGIVFQSPSLDKKLTVDENIACQAALYGIRGAELNRRRDRALEQLDLVDRRGDLCETLSGGLKRRVEIAKSILHRPEVLFLDEPSTGLDPSSRRSLFQSLREMASDGVSILMTTHLLEEADKADRVVILCDGEIACEGAPHELRTQMGQGLVTLSTDDNESVARILRDEMNLAAKCVEGNIRVRTDHPAGLVSELDRRFGESIHSMTLGRPSLEDVFIAATGQSFGESS